MDAVTLEYRRHPRTSKLADDRRRYRRHYAALRRKHAALYARAVVLSVPSKPDDNPEHIHLFDQGVLRELFRLGGIAKVQFSYVLNHLLAVAVKAPS